MSSNRLSALDGWRGTSILLVLAGHLLPLGPKAWNLNVAIAGSGMAIFFTLSGCLITSVLLRDDNIGHFLIRRLMRIVPLAWLAALVTLVLTGAGADRYLPHLFFYANTGPMWLTDATGHFWSLCVEVQFYVMIALLVLAFGRRSLAILPVLAVAVTVLRASRQEMMVINTPYRIDEILAGCTLALALDRFKSQGRMAAAAWLPLIGLPVLVLTAHPAGGAMNYLRPYVASTLVGVSLFAARESLVARLLGSRFLAYVASISYALYIIHGCLMFSWLGTGATTWVKYAKRPLFFLVTFGLAHFSTTHYERYFIDLGRRLTKRRRPDAISRPGEATPPLSILIVSEHASTRFGGEAALAFHYFRVMRARGLDVRLLTHARVRDELLAAFPEERARLLFIEDSPAQRWLWRVGKPLPRRLASFTTGFASRTITQLAQRRVARELVRDAGVQVVHQPMPVSPREPSLLFDLGAPVLIGPLNGNMKFPPGFRPRDGAWVSAIEQVGRAASGLMNTVFPGKRRAAILLVANERTAQALPTRRRGQVVMLTENGVDLSLFTSPARELREPGVGHPTRFVYMGRLVDWKAVDLLLQAFAQARSQAEITLTIIGDGPERAALEALATSLGIAESSPARSGMVHFAGWLSQSDCADRLRDSDALVLPSLWECGGAVVLEAMACNMPVIATAWGGPADYLDATSGLLIPPASREAIVTGFAKAMLDLSVDPRRRLAMGDAARRRVESDFDWERKVDVMLALYQQTTASGSSVSNAAT